ncbi:fas-associated protein [Anaeramoeba ignava]|uniref:Fas-associated protein n=1 Tax=Anaeramoeba ignava TaxID=1746090 RepID=A0A9Q0LAX5_ANAIG|nr:fas-associated protein [Anaeramoeba ignava]
MSLFQFNVKFQKQQIKFDIESTKFLKDLKLKLFELTGIKPERQKIIGIKFKDENMPLSKMNLKSNTINKIQLIGSKEEEISKIIEIEKKITEEKEEERKKQEEERRKQEEIEKANQELYEIDLSTGYTKTENEINEKMNFNNFLQNGIPNITENNENFKLFEEVYAPVHPAMQTGNMKKTLEKSKSSRIPVIVYLHSQTDIQNVLNFCQQILGDFSVSTFINTNFLFWVGDFDNIDPQIMHEFKNSINLESFPFLAVVDNVHELNILDVIQGPVDKSELFSRLMNLQEVFSTIHSGLLRKNSSALIRESQDQEYNESLKIDRERDQRELQEEIIKIKEEEEKKRKEEEEKEKLREKEENLLKKLPSEPKEDSNEEIVEILFRKIDGSRETRKFSINSTLEHVFLFAQLIELKYDKLSLLMTYPKIKFTLDDKENFEKTLKELNFSGKIVLFIEEN